MNSPAESRFGQGRVRADAGGHHHQVGGHFDAVLEPHRTHPALLLQQRLGLLPQQEPEAPGFQGGLQQVGGRLVQLTFHDPVGQVHHRHFHAPQFQAVGRLQAQQAGADDHGR